MLSPRWCQAGVKFTAVRAAGAGSNTDSLEADAILGNFNCASESPETAFVIADETLSHYPPKYSHMFQNPHSMQQNESVGGIRRKIISHSLLLPGTIESVSLFKIFATRQKRPANKVV